MPAECKFSFLYVFYNRERNLSPFFRSSGGSSDAQIPEGWGALLNTSILYHGSISVNDEEMLKHALFGI